MKRKKKRILSILSLILVVLIGWTLWGNTALEVNEYEIVSDRIPQGFDGFRIAQVSDLHNAEFGEGNGKLIEQLSQTDPDIIVITGDLIDSRHTDLKPAFWILVISGNLLGYSNHPGQTGTDVNQGGSQPPQERYYGSDYSDQPMF